MLILMSRHSRGIRNVANAQYADTMSEVAVIGARSSAQP